MTSILLKFESLTEPKTTWNIVIDENDFMASAWLKLLVGRLDNMIGSKLVSVEIV